MYSDFQFLWLWTKFLHMITSAQACKSFQEGFRAEIFGSFKDKVCCIQTPPAQKGFFIRGTSNQNCCFSFHFAVQPRSDLPDLWPFKPFKNQALYSQANTHSSCTLMSCKRNEAVGRKPRAQRAFEYKTVSKSLG